MPDSWCYINVFRFLFGSHTYLPAVALTRPYGLRQGLGAGKSACEPNKNRTKLVVEIGQA